ncbi:UPF0149 family protein [Pseudoalteromonas pernae]|uniref:UPF0149 family protein n=1 Tax=Pseudoalteromonas pernae TaxID=3118054 RepID=UPI003242C4DA
MQSSFEALEAFLNSKVDAMPFAKVNGYLFALVCAASPIEPDDWLAEVLGKDAAQTDESVLFALMNLHHHVSEQVYDTGFNLHKSVPLNASWQDNLASNSAISLWASGFNLGVSRYIDTLLSAEALEAETKEMLSQAILVLGLFSSESDFVALAQANAQNEQQFHDQVLDMMGDFSLGFADLIEISAVQSGLFDEEEQWQE